MNKWGGVDLDGALARRAVVARRLQDPVEGARVITALTHGVFDLLHAGHMEHLKQASLLCDHLVVSVVPDRFVNKRFIINDERTRMFQVSMVKGVFDVVLCDDAGPWNVLRKLRPDIYVRKDEYGQMIQPEYPVAAELGVECKFTKTAPPHAREIIQRIWALKGQHD